jgi:hypothetical protein
MRDPVTGEWQPYACICGKGFALLPDVYEHYKTCLAMRNIGTAPGFRKR